MNDKHSFMLLLCKTSISFLRFLSFITLSYSAYAFDDDRNISDIHLKDESFLDINASEFRKSLEFLWIETLNGWRATGGSVSTDRLFFRNELRIQKNLSNALSFGMELDQETFYARKPVPLPLVFLDVYPVNTQNVGISLIGTPAYDKRQSDIGYALTWGRRPSGFTRLSWLKLDKFYNDKNEFDDSYYQEYGESWKMEGVYRFSRGWLVQYGLNKDTPIDFIFENQTSRFQHKSNDYNIKLFKNLSATLFTGVTVRKLMLDKQLQSTSSNERQQIDYAMLDAYWVDKAFRGNRELTLGIRYDNFQETLTDKIAQVNSYDFKLTTWQAYSSLYYTYSIHQAWDLGLYLGWSERSKQYSTSSPDSFDDNGVQAKLRTSWQYHSIDKSSILLVSMSFNLDDLFNDPGDGGGMYFQTKF